MCSPSPAEDMLACAETWRKNNNKSTLEVCVCVCVLITGWVSCWDAVHVDFMLLSHWIITDGVLDKLTAYTYHTRIHTTHTFTTHTALTHCLIEIMPSHTSSQHTLCQTSFSSCLQTEAFCYSVTRHTLFTSNKPKFLMMMIMLIIIIIIISFVSFSLLLDLDAVMEKV